MHLDPALGERQADAEAAFRPVQRRFDLAEHLEDARHLCRADADAGVASPDEEHGEVPKAFVVLKSAATPEDLMAFVARRVAPYKKVRRLDIVDAIPKSPAGKLLRRALVEQERSRPLGRDA